MYVKPELESLIKRKNAYDKNWLMNYSHKPPNGESFYQLYKRVIDFIDEMLLKYSRKNIIIFSHGGPIRAAISYAISRRFEDLSNATGFVRAFAEWQ